jgi:hypothetical protein
MSEEKEETGFAEFDDEEDGAEISDAFDVSCLLMAFCTS